MTRNSQISERIHNNCFHDLHKESSHQLEITAIIQSTPSRKYTHLCCTYTRFNQICQFINIQIPRPNTFFTNVHDFSGEFLACHAQTMTNDIPFTILATNLHPSIQKETKKEPCSVVIHRYDVWHFTKNIIEKLSGKAKVKNYRKLGPWIQSISNHL